MQMLEQTPECNKGSRGWAIKLYNLRTGTEYINGFYLRHALMDFHAKVSQVPRLKEIQIRHMY